MGDEVLLAVRRLGAAERDEHGEVPLFDLEHAAVRHDRRVHERPDDHP